MRACTSIVLAWERLGTPRRTRQNRFFLCVFLGRVFFGSVCGIFWISFLWTGALGQRRGGTWAERGQNAGSVSKCIMPLFPGQPLATVGAPVWCFQCCLHFVLCGIVDISNTLLQSRCFLRAGTPLRSRPAVNLKGLSIKRRAHINNNKEHNSLGSGG